MAIDERVNLGGLEMATPLATASGTFGYGTEYIGAVDYSALGAITVKGIRLEQWPGNNMPRHAEVYGGLVNAIGLQGPGVEKFLGHYLREYNEKLSAHLGEKPLPKMIVNIWGGEVAEYAEVARRFDEAAKTKEGAVIGALECNVSCPNVKAGGHTFGQDPAILQRLVSEVRKATTLPLIVKLAPNFPDIKPYVKACEDGGADALSMINTIPAMVIDIEKRRPVLANRTGGLSGRAVHPVAVKVVYEAHKATKLPILAMGGVYEAKDAIELMLAGASAVALGSAIFVSPSSIGETRQGILDYCRRHGFKAVKDLTGALEQ